MLCVALFCLADSSQTTQWWGKPDWWVLVVAICTGGVIAWQSWETRKSAHAAKTAAESSLKQAEAQITSERAWLSIRSSMDGYRPYAEDVFVYKWRIENRGNTPARLIETQCRYELVRHTALTNLAPVPIYPAPISLCGFLLPPGEAAQYKTGLTSEANGESIERLEEADIKTIMMGMYYLRVYGYVQYLDAFENVRESRFCEHYIWPSDARKESGFRPLLGISPEYTRHT
jgi:hypothetical protein